MPSKFTTTLSRGQMFGHETAGGGGWGDPFERDPALVLEDVRNGFVSIEAARDDYGVVLDATARHVAAEATLCLRART
jgi:N-methylhydantoinase B